VLYQYSALATDCSLDPCKAKHTYIEDIIKIHEEADSKAAAWNAISSVSFHATKSI
jgi:hypothetical protein